MTDLIKVIGLGQDFAGDDAVGLEVLRCLKTSANGPKNIDCFEVLDPADLIDLLEGTPQAIIIDAVLDDKRLGQVWSFKPNELAAVSALSTHSMSVGQALELAEALNERPCQQIDLVAIGISRAKRYEEGLSPEVKRVIPKAIKEIFNLVRKNHA